MVGIEFIIVDLKKTMLKYIFIEYSQKQYNQPKQMNEYPLPMEANINEELL